MQTLLVGSTLLNIQLMLYVLFGLTGLLAIRIRLRGMDERTVVTSIIENAFIIWMIVWKGSLLLFDPVGVMQNPLSLIYFTAGDRSLWLAWMVTAIYIWRRSRRERSVLPILLDGIIVFLLSGRLVYAVVQAFLIEGRGVQNFAEAGVVLILLIIVVGLNRKIDYIRLGASVRKKKNVITYAILTGLLVYVVYNTLTSGKQDIVLNSVNADHLAQGIHKGERAPDFTLYDLGGNEVKLSDYRGKTVFVNFWATWCPPCKAEVPHMQQIYTDYLDKDVIILGVNLTSTEKNNDEVARFADQHELTFPIVLDEEGTVTSHYKVVAYPTTYVLDKDGVIREIHQGPLDTNMMRRIITSLF